MTALHDPAKNRFSQALDRAGLIRDPQLEQLAYRGREVWRRHDILVAGGGFTIAGLGLLALQLALSAPGSDIVTNLATELLGVGVTVLVIDRIYEGRRKREQTEGLKRSLILELGSQIRDVAVAAAERLRAHGWHADGSLRGAKLNRANLEGVVLLEAHLEGASLMGANLQGARLDGIHLEGARLQGVNLRQADLFEAHLEGANLAHARMEDAVLQSIDLQRARLARANLLGAFLGDANLQGANLASTRLDRAYLSGADLRDVVHLTQAQLDSAWALEPPQLPPGFRPPPVHCLD